MSLLSKVNQHGSLILRETFTFIFAWIFGVTVAFLIFKQITVGIIVAGAFGSFLGAMMRLGTYYAHTFIRRRREQNKDV